jgi:hypothetical protein
MRFAHSSFIFSDPLTLLKGLKKHRNTSTQGKNMGVIVHIPKEIWMSETVNNNYQ